MTRPELAPPSRPMVLATHGDQVVPVEHGIQGEDVSRGQRLGRAGYRHVFEVSVLHAK